MTPQSLMCFYFETFAIFLIKIIIFLILCFLFIYFGNFDVILHVLIFTEFLKRSVIRGGRYFLIFQLKICLLFMLKKTYYLCLKLNKSQPRYAYKCCVYKKECTCIRHKYTEHKPFWYLITLAYFVVSRNANIIVYEKQTKLPPRTLKCTLRKENFAKKKNENLRKEFLQLFVETSPDKLSLLSEVKMTSLRIKLIN